MRVALIDPSLFTWPYDSALSLALSRAGHTVAIFGKRARPADKGPARELLREHFYRPLESALAARLPRPLFLGAKGLLHAADMARLLAALRAFRPDVIHFQWAPLPAIDQLYLPLLRRIAPTVLTVHDSAPFNGNPRSALQMAGSRAIMARFDRLIVHTEAAARRLASYGLPAQRIEQIAHGALDDGAGPLRPPPSASSEDPSAPVRVLLFGRIKPYKGVDVLLKAAAAMSREALARMRIHVVGQPFMDLAPLEAFARQAGIDAHVQFEPRFIADDEIGPLLASAHVIALPYREIDASGVLMTSISAGLPIVASRVGLFAELLHDGRHGRLIDVGDHLGLARALEELVLQPELRARMAAEVRALRDAIPSWDAIAERTTELYADMLRSAAPRVPGQSAPRGENLGDNP